MRDEWPASNEELLREGECNASNCIEEKGHDGPHSGDRCPECSSALIHGSGGDACPVCGWSSILEERS